MKYLIIILLSTSVLIACTDHQNEMVVPIEASQNSDESPTILFEDLMTLSGPIYFEDHNGLKYSILDGTIVCSSDYPNLDFQKVQIANYAEYDGTITDSAGKGIQLSQGKVALVDTYEVNPQQEHCYTVTYYDVDVCPYGGKRLCWIEITYCRKPWELNYRQISVDRGCNQCQNPWDLPTCLNN